VNCLDLLVTGNLILVDEEGGLDAGASAGRGAYGWCGRGEYGVVLGAVRSLGELVNLVEVDMDE
jgi:hypothetical protein